ncbi:MAG: dimethylsulfonioproprionate lyase family protein [Pseudonocardiaceae bacterium]
MIDSTDCSTPVTLLPGGGRPLRVHGNQWSIKVTGAQTAGALAVTEATFAPGAGAPHHLHRAHEECFYVLSGRFRFRAGEASISADTGSFFYVPRNVAHSFENIGETPGRLLGIITPAGYEQYFIEMNDLPPGSPDVGTLTAIFSKYDHELA